MTTNQPPDTGCATCRQHETVAVERDRADAAERTITYQLPFWIDRASTAELERDQLRRRIAAVERVLAHAALVSPSSRMTVYATDVERALHPDRDVPVSHYLG